MNTLFFKKLNVLTTKSQARQDLDPNAEHRNELKNSFIPGNEKKTKHAQSKAKADQTENTEQKDTQPMRGGTQQ